MKMKNKNSTAIAFIAIIFIMIIGFTSFGVAQYRMEKTNESLKTELNSTQLVLDATKNELNTTKENLVIEIGRSDELSALLDMANTTISDLQDEEYKFVYLGDFKLTHYCNELYEHICGYGDGLTAIGTKVKPGYTIAVDPKVIPYGSKVYIEGYGWRVAEDCGGAVKGNHIDIAVDTHPEAMSKGVKTGGVWVLVENNP